MRRILLPLAIFAAAVAATIGGFTGSAQATATCSNVYVGQPWTTNNFTLNSEYSEATCTARWTAITYYQYESNGTWHYPDGTAWTRASNGANCSVDQTTYLLYAGASQCYGTASSGGVRTSDGYTVLQGYTGAGNNGLFKTTGIEASNAGDVICTVPWRLVLKLYQWSDGQLIQTNSNSVSSVC